MRRTEGSSTLEQAKKFTMIKRGEERPGQYSTRARAIAQCKREKIPHRYIFTSCFRNNGLDRRCCWFVYLDMGLEDAQFRAYGG